MKKILFLLIAVLMIIVTMGSAIAFTLTPGDRLDARNDVVNAPPSSTDITFNGTHLSGSFGFNSLNNAFTPNPGTGVASADDDCPQSTSAGSSISLSGLDNFCFSANDELNYLYYVLI